MGNILVVAMLIVPAAAAYMLTNRLLVMIVLSVLIGAASGVFGHLGAIAVPAAFGYQSTNTAGMMAVAAGVLFAIAVVLSPKYGIVAALRCRRAPRVGMRPAQMITE